MQSLPNLDIERSYNNIVIGIDEVGRGCIAGPVVAAAVILDQGNIPAGINDSKKLSKKKRDELFEQITSSHKYAISEIGVNIIDEINILQASKMAMREAAAKLVNNIDEDFTLLVDGNQTINFIGNNSNIIEKTVIKGDSKSLSIAAASIIAKVHRDRLMAGLAASMPQYDWENNAGYGTKKHLQAIDIYGINEHHRRSFAPISKMVA